MNNEQEDFKSATQLYAEHMVTEFMETLPDGAQFRAWLFYNILAFNVFLTWMVTSEKFVPDYCFLLYMFAYWLFSREEA